MDSIPDHWLIINATDLAALTQLLDLPDLRVTRLERAGWLQRIYRHCTVTTETAACPTCQCVSTVIYQYHRRTVRDRPWAGWAAYLQITIRRFRCTPCRRPFTEAVAAVAPYAYTTRRFAADLVANVRASSVAAIARAQQHGYKAVAGICYRHAPAAHPAGPPAGLVRRLGLDEIATRKGHGHLQLVLTDLDAGRVIAQLADRRQETLRTYLATWSPQQRVAVEEVATAFWAAYHTVAAELLPQARGRGSVPYAAAPDGGGGGDAAGGAASIGPRGSRVRTHLAGCVGA